MLQVPLREVCLLQSRPSVCELWMLLTLSMSPLSSPRRWESELIRHGVWRPPRRFSQVSLYRTSATLRDGLCPWSLSDFMALTLPSSRPRCAPQRYTLGRHFKVWQRGHLVPNAFSDAAWVPEEEISLGYVCNLSSSRKLDTASLSHTSGIPASTCLIPSNWCRFHCSYFIPAGHYVTPSMTSRLSFG